MSELREGKEGYLCGATRMLVKTMNPDVGACHCEMCIKWAGGPFLGVDCGTDVLFEETENISVFSSSEWAERGFCNKCGSHLFYGLEENNQYFVLIGLFEKFKDFILDCRIFFNKKPPFNCFSNETKNMTGSDFCEQFVPPSG